MMNNKTRSPKFLNLLQIRLPITGIASIGHRISGALLFLAIPLAIYCLELSLESAQSYRELMQLMGNPIFLVFLLLLVWSLLHHFCAGVRFLLLDIDVGVSRGKARASAWLVISLAVLGTALVALIYLFGGVT